MEYIVEIFQEKTISHLGSLAIVGFTDVFISVKPTMAKPIKQRTSTTIITELARLIFHHKEVS